MFFPQTVQTIMPMLKSKAKQKSKLIRQMGENHLSDVKAVALSGHKVAAAAS